MTPPWNILDPRTELRGEREKELSSPPRDDEDTVLDLGWSTLSVQEGVEQCGGGGRGMEMDGTVFKAMQGGTLYTLFHPVLLAITYYINFIGENTGTREGCLTLGYHAVVWSKKERFFWCTGSSPKLDSGPGRKAEGDSRQGMT